MTESDAENETQEGVAMSRANYQPHERSRVLLKAARDATELRSKLAIACIGIEGHFAIPILVLRMLHLAAIRRSVRIAHTAGVVYVVRDSD